MEVQGSFHRVCALLIVYRALLKRYRTVLMEHGALLTGQGVLRHLPFVLQEALLESGLHTDPLSKRLSLHYGLDTDKAPSANGRDTSSTGAFSSVSHAATHCNTQQHTCNTLQQTATSWTGAFSSVGLAYDGECPLILCNMLQHTDCDTLHHTATHCSTLQHTATHCNTLQHTATHCNTLHHTATHCNTLQHTATRCNTLQHTDCRESDVPC